MKIYAVFGKRRILSVILFLILGALIFGEGYSAFADHQANARSNEERIDYIYSLGVQVIETPINTENITIPFRFSDVYTAYNAIQLRAGFDLTEYCGKEVTKYTYRSKEEESTVVNLLVFNGRVIGGDISSVKLNGFMDPLIKKEKKG